MSVKQWGSVQGRKRACKAGHKRVWGAGRVQGGTQGCEVGCGCAGWDTRVRVGHGRGGERRAELPG